MTDKISYDRGYRKAERKDDNGKYNAGRKQGLSDAKRDVKDYINGKRPSMWFSNLLDELNHDIVRKD